MSTSSVSAPLPAGLPYDAFLAIWNEAVQGPPPVGDPQARRLYFYKKYNLERSARVAAEYEPSEAMRHALAALDAPQTWIVLTEDWCVDSAFALPVIQRAASLSPHVTLVVYPRDQHLDVMDRHLTNGSRSIPKLVAFDAEGRELFAWGPRPAGAVAYRQQLLDEGRDKSAVSAMVATWYEGGGWREADAEIAARVQQDRTPENGKVR